MKKLILILFLSCISFQLISQNLIGIQAGFLGTHTRIAEYERIGRMDYLLDSMSFRTNVGSVLTAIHVDVDLGKNFYLSTGFSYSNKGLANVTFTDSVGWPWQTAARQNYIGLSSLIGYRFHFNQSKFGLQIATGPKVDFAIGRPNPGALFSGPYYRFFMPFTRFSEVELSWVGEAGLSYKLGPGDIMLKVTYFHGISDVLEDAFTIGRTISGGITIGYAVRLTN
ncbi:MAG: hypothetical protein Q8M08_07820 [Bacteroidales bacterium]|nr:hypothetical protein [Bacteroidales bacterium]